MAEKKEKYIVIKKKDLIKLQENNMTGRYSSSPDYPRDMELHADIQTFKRVLKLLEHENEYLVINTDQPYAEPMWQILLAFEDTKDGIDE